jgi:hypothetical protein
MDYQSAVPWRSYRDTQALTASARPKLGPFFFQSRQVFAGDRSLSSRVVLRRQFLWRLPQLLQLICPSCRFPEFPSSPSAKNIPLVPSGKSVAPVCASRPHEGRFAIVTKRGWGCDGREWHAGRAWPTRTAKSRGPDLPTLGSSSAGVDPQGDGGYQARTPGRTRISRKPLRRECRLIRLNLWSLPPAFLFAGGPWVRSSPGIPCTLCFREGDPFQNSGSCCRGNARCCLTIKSVQVACTKARSVGKPTPHLSSGNFTGMWGEELITRGLASAWLCWLLMSASRYRKNFSASMAKLLPEIGVQALGFVNRSLSPLQGKRCEALHISRRSCGTWKMTSSQLA